jgi:hypothetical protein
LGTSPTIRRSIRRIRPLPTPEEIADKVIGLAGSTEKVRREIERALNAHTESLRGALIKLRQYHGFRFPLSGSCHCEACLQADRLINTRN